MDLSNLQIQPGEDEEEEQKQMQDIEHLDNNDSYLNSNIVYNSKNQNTNDNYGQNEENNSTESQQSQKQDNINIQVLKQLLKKYILPFVILIIAGNYLYFTPEKKCKFSMDEDCLRKFIDPNLTYWILSVLGSAVSFFILVYLYLVRDILHNLCYSIIPWNKNSEKAKKKQNKSKQQKRYSLQNQSEDESQSLLTMQNQDRDYMIQLRLKKYQRLMGIIALLNQLYIMIFTNDYIDPLTYYGAFKLGFNFITIILWTVFLIGYTCRVLFYFYGKKCLLISLSGLILFGVIFYYVKIENSCSDWLKGTYDKVDNSGQYCTIPEPKYCWANVFDGLFDASRLTSECEGRSYSPDYDKYAKFINNNEWEKKDFNKQYKFIGYPITTEWSQAQRMTTKDRQYIQQKEVLKRALFYKDLESAKKAKHEIIIDIKKQEVIYNIEKNEEIIKERDEIKNDSYLVDNVVVIFIDAVSRRNAYRQLPKTVQYLSKNQDLFTEFFRYHSIRRSTTQNLLQFFYNKRHPAEFPQDFQSSQKYEIIFEKMKRSGYITSHASDVCQTKSVQYGGLIEEHFQNNAMDHEGFSLACDPNYQNPENPFGFFQGPYSTIRRCYYQKPSYQHVFDYSLQFREKYLGHKTFQYLEFLDAHEGTGELLKYMDQALHDYIVSIDDGRTAIMLVSDHGLHMSEWTVLLPEFQEQLHLEMALAMLFIKLPEINQMDENQVKNLKDNQQKFVTMANLYHTLREWTGFERTYESSTPSLFQEIDSDIDCHNSIIDLSGRQAICACEFKK